MLSITQHTLVAGEFIEDFSRLAFRNNLAFMAKADEPWLAVSQKKTDVGEAMPVVYRPGYNLEIEVTEGKPVEQGQYVYGAKKGGVKAEGLERVGIALESGGVGRLISVLVL